MNSLALWFIQLYQRFLTVLSYGSCRYYPTCSQYAKEQFLHNSFLKAIFLSVIRILRCNQLFVGGIDYPVIQKSFRASSPLSCSRYTPSCHISFWFVPKDTKHFYVVKSFVTIMK